MGTRGAWSHGLKPALEHNVFSPNDVTFHEHAVPFHVYDVTLRQHSLVKPVSKESSMATEERKLRDLVSIGPVMLRDFELLGVASVAELSRRNPEKLYEKLCRIKGQTQDICCLDVFRAAVAQAQNQRLPVEQCRWWYWSRRRKARDGGR
jgi:hypothetical protein